MEAAKRVYKTMSEPIKSDSLVVQDKLQCISLRLQVLFQFFRVNHKKAGSLIESLKVINGIRQKYLKVFGEPHMSKIVKVDDRYYWRFSAPGFPSESLERMQSNELDRFYPERERRGLRMLVLSITDKCPLNCEHCYEWDNLNRNKSVGEDDLIKLIDQYQDYGTTQIMLSGGEPMLRFNTILRILENKTESTDFWILTSGLGLNSVRAERLKEKGLTGVVVSVDHYDAEKHDDFRGFEDSFNKAVQAIRNTRNANMVPAMSLCVTKNFATRENLNHYMDLARDLGVAFVQFFEASASGRYKYEDVSLSKGQIEILEEVYHRYNSNPDFANYPIINYPSYHQRRVGCFGSGDRYFYIDSHGFAHVCPLCTNKIANALDHSPEEMIALMANGHCKNFADNIML